MYSFSKFLKTKDGSIIIQFAFLFPILAVCLGGCIDFAIAVKSKHNVQSVIDAATLAGLKVFANKNIPEQYRTERAQERVKEMLDIGLYDTDISLKSFKTTFNIDDSGAENATSDWSLESAVSFLNLIQIDFIPVSGKSKARYARSTIPYTDIHFFIDNTGSMAVPYEFEQAYNMYLVKKCVFACHSGHNLYKWAMNSKYVFKIDIVKASIARLLNQIDDLPRNDDKKIRIAIHPMASGFENYSDPTENIQTAKDKLAKIDIPPWGYSRFNDFFENLRQKLSPQGGGSSTQDRKQVVVIFSDAYNDWPKDQPFSPGLCFPGIKEIGIPVITMHSPYINVNRHLTKPSDLAPINSIAAQSMEDCASDNMSYTTTSVYEFGVVMDDIFDLVTQKTSNLVLSE